MKRIQLALVFGVSAILFVLGSSTAQQENALDEVRQQWGDLYNQGDVEGVANLYTEDAALYDADGSVYEGRDVIQDALQQQIDMGFTQVSIEAIETQVLNGAAYEIGRYTVTADGDMASEGYFMVIAQRENNEWRIYRHIANMVLPEEMMSMMMGGGPRATIQVAEDDTHGEYLTDAEGRSLYLFLNDQQGESVCYDNCAQNWPPFLTTAGAEAGEGIDASLLGTTERQDGSMQVTYNDWPLYYFARDEAPGDVNGQGVGNNWYLVSPEGETIEGG